MAERNEEMVASDCPGSIEGLTHRGGQQYFNVKRDAVPQTPRSQVLVAVLPIDKSEVKDPLERKPPRAEV
jgi:hypothetical protein